MSHAVKPIPDGYNALTPYLVVLGAAEAIAFYKKAFGATELYRMPGPDGRIIHADLIVGGSHLFLTEEALEWGSKSPKAIGGTPVTIHMFVEDVDAVFASAVEAGATPQMPPMDMFWGDRFGKLTDPFGHVWSIATHIEDLSPEDMAARGAEAMKGAPCGEAKVLAEV